MSIVSWISAEVRVATRRVRHRIQGRKPSPVRPMSAEERAAAEDYIAREERALKAQK